VEPLADFVASAFALVPTGFERGNRGALGRIWRLRTADRSYAVKELFTPSTPDPRLVAAEVDVTARAAAAGVRVPLSHPAVDGSFVVPFDGRWVRVFDWLDLTPADLNAPEVAADLGRLLAGLHRAAPPSATEPDGGPPDPWFDVPPEPGRWVRWAKAATASAATTATAATVGTATPETAAGSWTARLAESVSRLEQLTALATPGWPPAMVTCHRDLHPENVLACEGTLAVVDWDNLGPAEPGRELAKVVFDWFFAAGTLDRSGAGRFWTAYRESGGPGRLGSTDDFGLLIAARLNFLNRQIGIALNQTVDSEHREWALKEIDEALTILPTPESFAEVLDLVA
jgi:Ser/Thr protein kinase RdoA (MazF antagonist)